MNYMYLFAHLAAAGILLRPSLSWASAFSTSPWIDDASTGLISGQTLWAYDFGSATPTSINGVTLQGKMGGSLIRSAGEFSITGFPYASANDTNSLTLLTGTGSADMAKYYIGGQNQGNIVIEGLLPGRRYTVSIFGVGFEAAGGRMVIFSSGQDSLLVDEDQFGNDAGIRVDYRFTATDAKRSILLTPVNANAPWQLYGLALHQRLRVYSTADSGAGSLRQALADAAAMPGADFISFAPALSGQTVSLLSEIHIDDSNVAVDGSALARGVTADGASGSNRIFHVKAGASATLKGLTLRGGNGLGMAASGKGGAIYNEGSLSVLACTLTANTANTGAGIFSSSSGTVILQQTTVAANASVYGGGLANEGSATVVQSTIARNSASTWGGGIGNDGGMIHLANSVVAENTAGDGADVYNSNGGVVLAGENIVPHYRGPAPTGPPPRVSAPNLAPLGDYGGPAPTLPPLAGSPAIDAGDDSLANDLATDQRGALRIRDGDGNGVSTVDIGAVEALPPQPFLVRNTADSGPGSLRQAVEDIAFSPGPDTITFTPDLSGQIITILREIERDMTGKDDLTVDASGLPGGITLDGGPGTNRILSVTNQGVPFGGVGLRGITLTGGNGAGVSATGNGGAILNNRSTVNLTRCTFSGNTATNNGGAIYNKAGALTLEQCIFSGNSAYFGGTILNENGSAALVQCAFHGNSSNYDGGAIANHYGSVTLAQSAFSGNTSVYGGAVDNRWGDLHMIQCTLAGNVSSYLGGAIVNGYGTMALTHCTLSGNTAAYDGGAVHNMSGPLAVINSLIAGNAAGRNGLDIHSNGPIHPAGVNLVGNLSHSGLSEGPLVIVDSPRLAPFGHYGGPTRTMALLPGSPARNAASALSPPLAADQRGFPIAGTPDIGAYEAGTLASNYFAYAYETLPSTTVYAWNASIPDTEHEASFDFDGDGYANEAEWIVSSDAGEAGSRFVITPARSGATLLFFVSTAAGRTYTLMEKSSLADDAWFPANGVDPRQGTGSLILFQVPLEAGHKFFRAEVSLP